MFLKQFRKPISTNMPTINSIPQQSSNRIPALDSLRGLAALSVVFHHILVTFPSFWSVYGPRPVSLPSSVRLLAYSPLHLAWGGLEAVILFYVLSGLVLTLPYLGNKPPTYSGFALKRICRIYIPYAAAIVVSTILIFLVEPRGIAGLSSWFNQFWYQPVSWGALLDHLLMLGKAKLNYIDPVVWSLIHEMRISLVFPVILYFTRRCHWSISVPASFAFSIAAKLIGRGVSPELFAKSLLETCSYAFLFIAGIQLAIHSRDLRDLYRKSSSFYRIGAFILSLGLLNARWELGNRAEAISTCFIWTGAILLVAIVISSQSVQHVLEHRLLTFLGRISFSLYLIHVIVLFALMYVAHGFLTNVVIACLVPPCSLIAAIVFHYFIEQPSMMLGRSLEKYVAQSDLTPVLSVVICDQNAQPVSRY